MLSNLTIKQQMLASYMSSISERCWYAGWLQGLEYSLWSAVVNGPAEYGREHITQDDINILKQLSEETGCWIIFDKEHEETAIDLDSWKRLFAQYQAKTSL